MSQTPNILAYSDKLFTPSESFIPRGYRSFSRLNPVFVGHEDKGPVPHGMQAFNLNAYHGALGEAGFKQAGVISEKLDGFLKELAPVAIHASFGKSGAYALPLARHLKIPLIVTYYGGDATKTSNKKDSAFRVYNRRRSRLWREAELILPCSDFIRRELVEAGAPEHKMVVHHNTADPEKFSPGDKSNLLLFAGRWTEKKGISTLIKALAELGSELDGWTVRLIGDGDLKPGLVAELEAAGVAAELPGWVPADNMPEHFAEASIVCVPSQRAKSGDAEGLPLVCIEAMLSGCALAATYHAGIPECVKDGETGYLVEEGDHKALAANLRKMLNDPDQTRRMGEAGRELALEDFNLAKQSKKLETMIYDCARRAGTIE